MMRSLLVAFFGVAFQLATSIAQEPPAVELPFSSFVSGRLKVGTQGCVSNSVVRVIQVLDGDAVLAKYDDSLFWFDAPVNDTIADDDLLRISDAILEYAGTTSYTAVSGAKRTVQRVKYIRELSPGEIDWIAKNIRLEGLSKEQLEELILNYEVEVPKDRIPGLRKAIQKSVEGKLTYISPLITPQSSLIDKARAGPLPGEHFVVAIARVQRGHWFGVISVLDREKAGLETKGIGYYSVAESQPSESGHSIATETDDTAVLRVVARTIKSLGRKSR